ncbi:accessory gene regulator ArgB-like protein [Sedimentibacter sp. B4]|uniref:accessory gene regulator ArgB-like protein n=1 Tax=Sedimentibacter sp. B4 TaxID=304766 RepID=UPI00030C0EFC|nr:accessory gene regulator B family protein [Sedimentibacter sp. B4]
MNWIDNVSKSFASIVSSNLSLGQDQEEVIAYGAFALIQTVLSIFAIVAFGLLLGVFAESMIISFAAAILRKFSGGVHATKPLNCAVIGMIIFCVLGLLVKYLMINIEFVYLIGLMALEFAFVFYVMIKYSPVGSANKPLKNPDKRKRLKKQSLMFTLSMLAVNIVLTYAYVLTNNIKFLTVAVCISTGILWQSITLVSLGHIIIESLDTFMGGTTILNRRANK